MQDKRNIVFLFVLVYNILYFIKEGIMRFENEFIGMTVKEVLIGHLGFPKEQ